MKRQQLPTLDKAKAAETIGKMLASKSQTHKSIPLPDSIWGYLALCRHYDLMFSDILFVAASQCCRMGDVTVQVTSTRGRKDSDQLWRIFHSAGLASQGCTILVSNIDPNDCFLFMSTNFWKAKKEIDRIVKIVKDNWKE